MDPQTYRDRLLTLKLLPLTFDRELKDLVFFSTNVGMVLLILMFMILFLLFLTAEPD